MSRNVPNVTSQETAAKLRRQMVKNLWKKNLIFKKADLKAKKSSLENLTPSSYWSKQDLLSLCSVLSTPIGVQGGGQSAAPPPPTPATEIM